MFLVRKQRGKFQRKCKSLENGVIRSGCEPPLYRSWNIQKGNDPWDGLMSQSVGTKLESVSQLIFIQLESH